MKYQIFPFISAVCLISGGVLTYVCLTNPSAFKFTHLRYFFLFIGIMNIATGVLIGYINWKSSEPMVKKATLLILLFYIPFAIYIFYLATRD